ncbi:MAG: AbrB/MazE/SpoVT family DNA-binding domain-containing protein [Minisyncoccales bacterium]
MKNNYSKKINGPMHNVESFGSTTLGKRGQVVIPAEIRKKMNLKAGENFIALLVDGSIVFLPAEKFEKMVSQLEQTIDKFKEISN